MGRETMTPENDVQAYREWMAVEYANPGKLRGHPEVMDRRKAFLNGFDAGRDLGELQGMVKALETVLSTNPYSPLVQRTATEARELLRELLKSGEK